MVTIVVLVLSLLLALSAPWGVGVSFLAGSSVGEGRTAAKAFSDASMARSDENGVDHAVMVQQGVEEERLPRQEHSGDDDYGSQHDNVREMRSPETDGFLR